MTALPWTYDVALSFAGEDREPALDMATRLHAVGIRVFFDRFEELWGQDLTLKLQEVYGREARYCVVLVSKDYLLKPWTNHERRILVARTLSEARTFLLPIRIDDSELPGLPAVIAYKDLRTEAMSSIVESLRAMVSPRASEASRHMPGTSLELVPSDFLYAVVHRDSAGTARFNLNYHLVNTTTEAHALHRLEATVTPPAQRGVQFMWRDFVEIGATSMRPASEVLPLALGAKASRLLGAQFVGPRFDGESLWRAGRHEVEIVGWVDRPGRDATPDLRTTFTLTVTDEEAATIGQGADIVHGDGSCGGHAVAVPLSIAAEPPERADEIA